MSCGETGPAVSILEKHNEQTSLLESRAGVANCHAHVSLVEVKNDLHIRILVMVEIEFEIAMGRRRKQTNENER